MEFQITKTLYSINPILSLHMRLRNLNKRLNTYTFYSYMYLSMHLYINVDNLYIFLIKIYVLSKDCDGKLTLTIVTHFFAS